MMKAALSTIERPAARMAFSGETARPGLVALLVRLDRYLRWRRDLQRLHALPDYLLDDIGVARDSLD
jgi:uncharacterized protein YjiS (DUF1127 family)